MSRGNGPRSHPQVTRALSCVSWSLSVWYSPPPQTQCSCHAALPRRRPPVIACPAVGTHDPFALPFPSGGGTPSHACTVFALPEVPGPHFRSHSAQGIPQDHGVWGGEGASGEDGDSECAQNGKYQNNSQIPPPSHTNDGSHVSPHKPKPAQPLPGGGGGGSRHGNTERQVVDGLRTEVCGQQKQSNDPRNNQHILNTPTTGRR